MNVSLDVYGKDISVHILTAATQFVFHQGCYLEHPKEGELSLTYCGPYDNMFLQRGLNVGVLAVFHPVAHKIAQYSAEVIMPGVA